MTPGPAMAPGPATDGRFGWSVPQGWRQGRGAWGGLVIGAMLRAMQAWDPVVAPVRTVSAQISSPVIGDVEIAVRALRSGSSMTTWHLEVRDVTTDAHLAQATVITAADRQVEVTDLAVVTWRPESAPAPSGSSEDWREVPVLPVRPPMGPEFAAHLEFRATQGLPLSGGGPCTSGWIRDPLGREWDDVRVLAVVDAWWPSLFVSFDSVRPMATVDFTAHLVGDPSTALSGEPLRYASELLGFHAGYATERRRLWSRSGVLLVESMQSLAVIR